MPWFGGSSLLHHLETVHIASDRNFSEMRFPGPTGAAPESGVSRLRRPDGLRRPQAGRSGHGAAVRPYFPREVHRHLRWRSGAGVSSHVGHRLPRRRSRYQPRQHAGPSVPSSARHPLHRRAPGLDGQPAPRSSPPVHYQAHHPVREGAGSPHPLPGEREHAGAAAGLGAEPERNRHGGHRYAFAPVRRPVPAQPHDRQLRDGGPDLKRHRRGRHGHRARPESGSDGTGGADHRDESGAGRGPPEACRACRRPCVVERRGQSRLCRGTGIVRAAAISRT